MTKRLLNPNDLPLTLWRREEDRLVLPDSLSRVYCDKLVKEGLLKAAFDGEVTDGPVGGLSLEDTRKHFASRFSGSSARTQLAILDPKGNLKNVSDLFVRAFSGGRVGLLDIPCGAGAACVDLLSSIAELRRAEVLPRHPLEVCLVAGDISPYARTYASDLLIAIKGDLEREAIYVTETFVEWDIMDSESTTRLLHVWMERARGCREHFVVLANFSGFLQRESKFEAAKKQLEEVFRWAAERRSVVVWIEPKTNIATSNFIPALFGWLRLKLPKRFTAKWLIAEPLQSAECRFLHPIRPKYCPRVQLNLVRLEAT